MTLLAPFAFVQHTRIRSALAGLGVVLGIYGAFCFVNHETSRPEIRLGYELARYIDKNVQSQDYVMVLAKPIAPDSLNLYFNNVRELSGQPGLREAQKQIESVDSSPLDYQRALIHMHLRARSSSRLF